MSKQYDYLSDRFTLKPKYQTTSGQWGESYADFMAMVDHIIGRATGEGLTSEEFGDTVMTHDAWDNGENPVDVAEEILVNDCIGEQFLALALGREVV